MPLEIWIMLMTLFNVFLIVTYLYFRTLHLNAKSKFDEAVENLDKRVSKFEERFLVDVNSINSSKILTDFEEEK